MLRPMRKKRVRLYARRTAIKSHTRNYNRKHIACVIAIVFIASLYIFLLFNRSSTDSQILYSFAQDMQKIATPFPSADDFIHYATNKPPFDIDVVYCYAGQVSNANNPRNRDNSELKYSLRSIYKHIPWIHNIFIVVPESLAIHLENDVLFPSWLDSSKLKSNNIYFISQSSIFRNHKNGINNHNSNAIEANIMRIPHLSEHFIYFNDDFFIGRPLPYSYFFSFNVDEQRQYVPRWPLNHCMKYFKLDNINRPRTGYNDVYDYKVYELEGKTIPNRVNHYVTHAPRPLTKSMLRQYIDVDYKDYFAFMESHKTRWCSSPNIWNVITGFNVKYCVQILYLWITQQSYYSTNHCAHEETLFLSLFKSYLQREITVDIMQDPPDHKVTNYYVYNKKIEEKCKDIERIKPYTFNLNDDFGSEQSLFYIQQVNEMHKCLETQFPDAAAWEIRI